MSGTHKRHRLMPWTIGSAIIVLAIAHGGRSLLASDCALPAPTLFLVLIIMPAVYLVLVVYLVLCT